MNNALIKLKLHLAKKYRVYEKQIAKGKKDKKKGQAPKHPIFCNLICLAPNPALHQTRPNSVPFPMYGYITAVYTYNGVTKSSFKDFTILDDYWPGDFSTKKNALCVFRF